MSNFKKKTLLSSFMRPFETLGYKFLEDKSTVAHGLFYKILPNNLVLELGFTISNLKSKYTLSYYLSRGFQFGLVFGDMPSESYARIAKFLEYSERLEFLPKDYHGEKTKDGWWASLSLLEIEKVMEVVRITESRFLRQENLAENIMNSNHLKDRISFYEDTFKHFLESSGISKIDILESYKMSQVPSQWVSHMEREITQYLPYYKLSKQSVQAMSDSSWRYIWSIYLKLIDTDKSP